MKIKLQGLEAALGKLAEKAAAAKAAARSRMIVEAQAIKVEAQKRAPVDTGALASTITKLTTGDESVIQTNQDYAQYVEFGTMKQVAQPFMKPTFEALKDEAAKHIIEAAREALKK